LDTSALSQETLLVRNYFVAYRSERRIVSPDFESRLKAQVDFPSPSRVATEVIALARDPDIEIAKVAQAVSRDPAMTAKILRIANSAFYAQRRPSQNLRQALVIIGLNAALTLALSFSLVSTLRSFSPTGIDYRRFWRRSLLAATAARAFGEIAKVGSQEDIFLSALLQDVGILAIDRTDKDFYNGLDNGASHLELIAYEIARLQKDHAEIGSMLLKTWNLPSSICESVQLSHHAEKAIGTTDTGRGQRCVALGSELADAALTTDRFAALAKVSDRATRFLPLRAEQFTEIVSRVLSLAPEAEELYETSIIDASDAEDLLAQARELLAVRSLQTLQEVQVLQEATTALQSRAEQLEDATRRDPLTGIFNRAWLDQELERELQASIRPNRVLSIAMVELDQLKAVRERLGDDAANIAMRGCAQIMHACLRGSDGVARYTDDEFIVLLTATDTEAARQVCARMLVALRDAKHDLGKEQLTITASIGLATCTQERPFKNVSALLEAADHALYAAKLRGRNRTECFDDLPT
jgi:diguanylate cyclase (GGDEF)-like protein